MASDELNGVQKAAVLLIALGPEKSAEIFKHLKEEEIEEPETDDEFQPAIVEEAVVEEAAEEAVVEEVELIEE